MIKAIDLAQKFLHPARIAISSVRDALQRGDERLAAMGVEALPQRAYRLHLPLSHFRLDQIASR